MENWYELVRVKYGPLRTTEVATTGAGWVRLSFSFLENRHNESYPLGVDEAEKVALAMLEAVKREREQREIENDG